MVSKGKKNCRGSVHSHIKRKLLSLRMVAEGKKNLRGSVHSHIKRKLL
jgi:hypothetical protein